MASVLQRATGSDPNGVNGDVTATFSTQALTPGSIIIVAVPLAFTTTAGLALPTDTAGNKYTQIKSIPGGTGNFVSMLWFIAHNSKAQASNIVTCNPDPGAVNMHAWETTGLINDQTFDKCVDIVATTGTALSSGATPGVSSANGLAFGVFCVDANDTYIIGSGWSNGQTVANTAFSSYSEEQVISAPGAYTATATASTSTTSLSVIMTFQAAGPLPLTKAQIPTRFVGPMALRHNKRFVTPTYVNLGAIVVQTLVVRTLLGVGQ